MQNSRRKIKSDLWDKIYKLFFEVVGKKNKQQDFDVIVSGIISPAEKIMIAKRLTIMYLLLKKIDTNTICKTLSVTRSTVAKCTIMLENNQKLNDSLNSIILKSNISDLFKSVINEIYGPGTPGISWSSAWKAKRELKKRKEKGM